MSNFIFDIWSVVYKKDVYKITNYKKKHINDIDYYELSLIFDIFLKNVVYVNNNFINVILSKADFDEIVDMIPSIYVM